ncbi:hypothetical protein IF1G_09433 [Cordyceps javanica]|uniref:Uncharacterized protein n=1 Tax=Cordyceps javanica TaxID=43265 RepID=A0A545UQW8_9HYPO|nr:hypothetical protein IF1G_09433 [Cordyceps javanica]
MGPTTPVSRSPPPSRGIPPALIGYSRLSPSVSVLCSTNSPLANHHLSCSVSNGRRLILFFCALTSHHPSSSAALRHASSPVRPPSSQSPHAL